MWFRSDLRVLDNKALFFAMENAIKNNHGLMAVFFVTQKQWQEHDMAQIKMDFIVRNLKILKVELKKKNIPLVCECCDFYSDIPGELTKVCEEHDIDYIYANREYGVNEVELEQDLHQKFSKQGKTLNLYDDFTLLAPGSIRNKTGLPYKVFTPFRNAVLSSLLDSDTKDYTCYESLPHILIEGNAIPQIKIDMVDAKIIQRWPAGEVEARKKLDQFLLQSVQSYKEQRDIPSVEGTSSLSPYLALGVISVRTIWRALKTLYAEDMEVKETGVFTWANELIWRDFYQHVLYDFPRVSKHLAFNQKTERIKWSNDEKHLLAWQQGLTGYPIVDAAMRQLNQTGWMHNRLRMITAMFFSKNLLMDWRLGEKYFMRHLIDGGVGR